MDHAPRPGSNAATLQPLARSRPPLMWTPGATGTAAGRALAGGLRAISCDLVHVVGVQPHGCTAHQMQCPKVGLHQAHWPCLVQHEIIFIGFLRRRRCPQVPAKTRGGVCRRPVKTAGAAFAEGRGAVAGQLPGELCFLTS